MVVFPTIESDRVKNEIKKTISNTILFENIQEYSKNKSCFLNTLTSSIIWKHPKNDISTRSKSRKIVGIQPIHVLEITDFLVPQLDNTNLITLMQKLISHPNK